MNVGVKHTFKYSGVFDSMCKGSVKFGKRTYGTAAKPF